MNLLEKAIAVIAPDLAFRRMRSRLAADLLSKRRGYDGAATGRRTSSWSSSGNSANTETKAGADKLRNLARDLERNNAWAVKALATIDANTVGTGIRAQAKHANTRKTKKAMEVWQGWAESTACDFDGQLDFYGIQALATRTAARDGEALVRFRRVAPMLIPLQLQLLEVDYLDTTKTSAEDTGNRVIQGVEVDAEGRRVAYWLYEQHPGEVGLWPKLSGGYKSNRIPADQLTRVYRIDRAGQLRGVSWFAPVMLPLRDLDDYEDAQLIRQKIAACFSVFIHDSTDDLTEASDEDTVGDKVEPGIIERLPPGKAVSFANPPGVDGYSDFVRNVLRKVAAGLGVTYEVLTGDLTSTNYSSGRMGWIEFHRNIEAWRWRMLIPQLCMPVWAAFIDAARLSGADLAGVMAEWTPPRRELINPKEEIAADRDAIRSGQKTLSEVIRERGYDPAVVLEEWAADAKRLDALGLVLDCDPRKTTQQGQPRDKVTPGGSDEPES